MIDGVYGLFARLTLLLHLAFLLFVVLGGLLVKYYESIAWIHLPCVLWALGISFFELTCPLTPLEKWFLQQANYSDYPGSFINYYLTSIIYPEGLTPSIMIGLGIFVLAINVYFYADWITYR